MAPVDIDDTTIEYGQQDRRATLTTPLGQDKLVLHRFRGVEGLSTLFDFTIDALSKDENLNFDAALGKNCHVKFSSYDGIDRVFNGVLVEADWFGTEDGSQAYRLQLRPWIWLLGRQANCRIYKDKSVLDIIKDVFKTAGFSDYEVKAPDGDYAKIEYTVQYRETDLAFVSRLMEEWGLYTFHEHSESKHDLKIADSRSCHVATKAGGGKLPFRPLDGTYWRDCEHLRAWRSERSFRTGQVKLKDYDFKRPGAPLLQKAQAQEKYEKSSLEAFDYPGRYVEEGRGDKFSKIRLEAEQAADRRRYASGEAPNLHPGSLFTLTEHGPDNGQYLVVEARHSFGGQTYRSTGEGGDRYEGAYAFQPVDRPFRAPLATTRPLVHGPQTAVVVTKDGKKDPEGEIEVDEHGRVFVQFHWNRDDKIWSLPVRVAQKWSGPSWGWQFIPRIAQEVIVEFLEGDPDKPLVTGTVYNGDNKYPYDLPSNKTQSGVKSKTYNASGYNEVMFEDKKGEENFRMHAQRLHDVTVRLQETRTIGCDNKDSDVALETTIEHGHEKRTLKHGDRSTLLKMGDENLKLEMGDQNIDLELGDQNTHVTKNINIKGDMGIKITCGQSSIEMTPMSIKIESMMIQVNGQVMTEVKGSAMLTLKGGITMIN